MEYLEEIVEHLMWVLPTPKCTFPPTQQVRELAAQIKTDDEPYAQALKSIAEGKFDCADEILHKMQITLDRMLDEIQLWQTRIHVARILNACYAGRFQDALRWGDRLELLVNDELWLLSLLSQLYFTNECYEKAEAIIRRELEVTERSSDSANTDIAFCMFNLAETLRMTNRLSEAETLYQRSRQIYEQIIGANHPKIAKILIKLAVLYRTSNNVTKMKHTLEQIEAICTKSDKEKHPDTAEVLYYLATLYEKEDQFRKAKRLYKQALKIAKSRSGKDHPNVLKILEGLDRCRAGNKETRGN